MHHRPRCFLLGMRASGKSTAGRALAERLGWAFADTDDWIREHSGGQPDIAAIVAAEGWVGFRARESAALRAVAEDFTVIATGGGVILDPENRRFMRESGLCIYLDAAADVLIRRLELDPRGGQRPPLLAGCHDQAQEVRATLAARETLYGETAHSRVDAALEPAELVGALEALVRKHTMQHTTQQGIRRTS